MSSIFLLRASPTRRCAALVCFLCVIVIAIRVGIAHRRLGKEMPNHPEGESPSVEGHGTPKVDYSHERGARKPEPSEAPSAVASLDSQEAEQGPQVVVAEPVVLEELLNELGERYKNASATELQRCAKELDGTLSEKIDQVCAQRLFLGFYESIPFQYDDGGVRVDFSEMACARDKYVRPIADPLISRVFQAPDDQEWRCVDLAPADYPEIYALSYEHTWLRMVVGRAAHADTANAIREVRGSFLLSAQSLR